MPERRAPLDSDEYCDGSRVTWRGGSGDIGWRCLRTLCRAAAAGCAIAPRCVAERRVCGGRHALPRGGGRVRPCRVLHRSSPSWPLHAIAPTSQLCRAAVPDGCDVFEFCNDGAAKTCPSDSVRSAGTVCRFASDTGDATEVCNGASSACPADRKQAAGTVCRSAVDLCDAPSSATACRTRVRPTLACLPAGTVCRAAAHACDIAGTCSGTSDQCPPDAYQPSTRLCRPATQPCDVAEFCSGDEPACPIDEFESAGVQCRAASGVCDVAEQCTGSSPACPADGKRAAGTLCRTSSGVCDVAEVCDGASNNCPSDEFAPASQVCRTASGLCDVASAANLGKALRSQKRRVEDSRARQTKTD